MTVPVPVPDDRDDAATSLLGPLELAALRVLFEHAPATVRTVLEGINSSRREPLAYTSVLTVLDRLHDKGLATRVREGRAFRYSPAFADEAATVDHLGARAVDALVGRLGDVALVHFAAALEDLDPVTRARLEAIAAERGA